MDLTDKTFNNLMNTRKRFHENPVVLPVRSQSSQLDVLSVDNKESFIINIDRRGRIEMKSKLQERLSSGQALIRVEINAPPHRNPDDTLTSRNHIHIYKEGFAMSWAYNLEDFDENLFSNLGNFNKVFVDFCSYCNIELNNNFQMVI